MSSEVTALLATAASLGLIHTLLGPDHYVPFVALSRAGAWSIPKTILVTVLAGLGHVLSSVVLGLVGIGLGTAVARLEGIESVRGDIAAWLLFTFGLVYMAWGLRRAFRSRSHTHAHQHGGPQAHEHEHDHQAGHVHVHAGSRPNLTPWVLFVIFVFGPCEPLIPLLMYPAARHDLGGVMPVAATFGLVTVGTMLTLVLLGSYGLQRLPTARYERFAHAAAGLSLALCGAAVLWLGL